MARALVCAAVLNAGCGSSAPTAPTPAVSGEWVGVISSPADGAKTIGLELAESGGSVTGSLYIVQGIDVHASGTVAGTVSGGSPASLQLTATYTSLIDCRGSLTATLKLAGGNMTGSYAGQDCAHSFSGTLQATKQ